MNLLHFLVIILSSDHQWDGHVECVKTGTDQL